MTIEQAQQDVRRVFRAGVVGQCVSAVLWTVAAALATWVGRGPAVAALALGGALIFPVTRLVLAALGGPSGLPAGHPMNALGTQVALVVPLALPVAFAAARARAEWFFPACLVLVGAHYLPFVFLYGMPEFAVLAVVMTGAGLALALSGPGAFAAGAWLGAGLLAAFALVVALRRRPGRAPAA